MKLSPEILVAHPYYRTNLTLNFYLGMINTISSYGGPLNIQVKGGYAVAKNRNELIKFFLKTKAKYIFFVDVDMGLPTDGLKTLVEDNKDIIGGLYFERIPPHNPILLYKNDATKKSNDYIWKRNYPEGVVEVDATGAGCLLIKREVLKNMSSPWFYDSDDVKSEDIYFCEKAKELGYKIFVDTTVKVSHFTEMLVSEETKRFYDQRLQH